MSIYINMRYLCGNYLKMHYYMNKSSQTRIISLNNQKHATISKTKQICSLTYIDSVCCKLYIDMHLHTYVCIDIWRITCS